MLVETTKIQQFRGTSRDIGLAMGQSMGGKLLVNIDKMIDILNENKGMDFLKLEKESMSWLENLPFEYQEELKGISQGSGCPVEKIAQWYYSNMCIEGGCTSFIVKGKNGLWVGRNNDYLFPGFWGYVNIIKPINKIPVLLFGLEGDIFSGTGFNEKKLWLHYNWLPAWDEPSNEKALTPFVFIRFALERCKSIEHVENLLQSIERDGGMNLVAVDGERNETAIFECTCKEYKKRRTEGLFAAAANHFCTLEIPAGSIFSFQESKARQKRVEELLTEKNNNLLFEDYKSILADPKVEQHKNLEGTVYSNIACPGKNIIWFAHSNFPAASRGNWERLTWDW